MKALEEQIQKQKNVTIEGVNKLGQTQRELEGLRAQATALQNKIVNSQSLA